MLSPSFSGQDGASICRAELTGLADSAVGVGPIEWQRVSHVIMAQTQDTMDGSKVLPEVPARNDALTAVLAAQDLVVEAQDAVVVVEVEALRALVLDPELALLVVGQVQAEVLGLAGAEETADLAAFADSRDGRDGLVRVGVPSDAAGVAASLDGAQGGEEDGGEG